MIILHRNIALVTILAVVAIRPVGAFWKTSKQEQDSAPVSGVEKSGVLADDVSVEYGVDVSFPMHHSQVSDNYAWLPHNLDSDNNAVPDKYKDMAVQPLGDRMKFYKDYVDGCVKKFGDKGDRCIQNERDRIAMSLRQPQSMQNYTEVGFKKIKAPAEVFALIKEFWDKNKENQSPENWGIGNIYTNNWDSSSFMVSVEDSTLRGGGAQLKQHIWNAARDTIQEWTGEELTQCSLYGIRIYTEGAVLATHVDRLPLVSSAIINVAQDVDEPWPLEVIGHDGKATNVTMEPGDMVLYESHSVLHGRPFPMKGRYMANIFIHFEPTGHSLRHNAIVPEEGDIHQKYREATARRVGGHEVDQIGGLPPYIIPGTPEESNWKRNHPGGQKSKQRSFATGSTGAHEAAQKGDLPALAKVIEKDKRLVSAQDENGWAPIHEGARGGYLGIVKYLHENGADVNARTGEGNGGSVLWWAENAHGSDHPVVSFLASVGALNIGPEL